MEKRKIVISKPLQKKKKPTDVLGNKSNRIKNLWKYPLTKVMVFTGALYGILFISKYIINAYAEVVLATKKLKNAYKVS